MNDLISRAAAIEYLMTNMGWHDEDGYEVDDADEKRKIITDLVNGIPAVDAAPVVHAKWIPHKTQSGRETVFERCSMCSHATVVTRKSPFCPNCGAKMTGDDNE